MGGEIKAGATYFTAVFFVAFVLGVIRVLVLVPQIGVVISVLLEAPVILAVSWFVSRRVTARFRLSCEVSSRLAMGAIAFVLLMIVELAISTVAFREPMKDYFAAFWSPQGMIGLSTQIIFAFIPLIQRTQHHPSDRPE